jgi:inosine-uridine nucleoside N-ribohydrolase
VATGQGKLAKYARSVYLETAPLKGTSVWSMMWDELTVASILDPSVITKAETAYLDVDTSHGPDYGHTVVWKSTGEIPEFFLPYSGPEGVDSEKWRSHLQPPAFLHPATVQMSADKEKFYNIFVELMTR